MNPLRGRQFRREFIANGAAAVVLTVIAVTLGERLALNAAIVYYVSRTLFLAGLVDHLREWLRVWGPR